MLVSKLRQPDLESNLLTEHAILVSNFEKLAHDYKLYVCLSCERLHKRASVVRIDFSDERQFDSDIWLRLKAFAICQNPNIDQEEVYMCVYCKPLIKRNTLPSRCVINGLQTVAVPPELETLDALSAQLIQRAKCYQTVVRLGTYTNKVPVYKSLKTCRGTMFFLPLPMKKTLETLDQVESSKMTLPDPELYIIVDGTPTKNRVVWRTLVDVNKVKKAVEKLRQINWLYKEVSEQAVDDCTKQVVEVVNSATSTMIEKANESYLAGLQAYTVRNLDNKLPTLSDIDQYKMDQYKIVNVKEFPLESRQQHLDLMCFPALFPTGAFGENHKREVHIGQSEFAKSRLLNKDPRFRKDAQYVFYCGRKSCVNCQQVYITC